MKCSRQGTEAGDRAGASLTPVALALASFAVCLVLLPACSTSARIAGIEAVGAVAELSLPEDLPDEEAGPSSLTGYVEAVGRHSDGESVLMRAERDDETGEMVAVDRLDAAVVRARFRNVAEREGVVRLEFRVTVPESVRDPGWQLRLHPEMSFLGGRYPMDDIVITGEGYRQRQQRGYERYRRFLSRIVTDSLEFYDLRSLEIFLARNLPELYAFRNDSSLVSDSEFESAFGVSSSEAAGHYIRRSVIRRNERLLAESPSRFRRYVGSPAGTEGVRLDTVLQEGTGEFVYDYVQVIPALPGLRKVQVSLSGEIYGHESVLYTMPPADTMTFYISSISTLCDSRWKDMVRDTASYMMGIRLLEGREYKAALEVLLPFRDYNTAVALVALGRDRYALDLLGDCPPTAGVNYLLAIVHARLGHEKKAAGYLATACAEQPSFRHRARLDPEISGLIERYETDMEH